MTPTIVLWLGLVGLVVAGLAAIGRRSLIDFSRHELEHLCQRQRDEGRLTDILERYESAALKAEALESIGVVLALGATVWWAIPGGQSPAGGSGPLLAATLVLAALVLVVLLVWVPWAAARVWSTGIVYHGWPFWRAVDLVLSPLFAGSGLIDRLFHRIAGRKTDVPDEEAFEEEIRSMVSEGHREGLLEEEAREMIEGVMELGDVQVSEVMTPRTEMVSLASNLSWSEMLEFVIRTGHTRIPVYEKNRDDILGILYAKDLLPELAKMEAQPAVPWTSLLRQASFVPESKPVDDLLRQFQQSRSHLVMVLDEYGGVSGLVTIEDVLEEIVGEIVDEYDKDLVDGIRQVDEQTAEILGRVHIDEVNERLQLGLPEEADYDTVGGFVFAEMGHIPSPGEQLVWNNLRFTVLDATRRRIESVRVEILQAAPQDSPSG